MKAKSKKVKLTEKQKIFCREYIKSGWNATKAAISAGYSKKTARIIGNQNLSKLYIQEYITKIRGDNEELSGISFVWAATALKKMVECSPSHFLDSWIERKDFDKIPENIKEQITEISTKVMKKNIGTSDEPEIVDVEYVNIKFPNKITAIQEINKMMGYLATGKVDITSNGQQMIQLPPVIIQLATDLESDKKYNKKPKK